MGSLRNMTTPELDHVRAAAGSGDRQKLRVAVRNLRRDAYRDGVDDGYALGLKRVADRIRASALGPPTAAELLAWLDQEATG